MVTPTSQAPVSDTRIRPRPDVFSLPLPFASRAANAVASWVTRPLEKACGLRALGGIYASLPEAATPHEFCTMALEKLGVTVRISDEDLARIPKTGPVLLVANHPFGAIEGIVLGRLLGDVRPDFRLMANFLLGRIPELRDALITVDPFGGRNAPRRNLSPMRKCLSWLRDGGALGVFPSGEVAHLSAAQGFSVTDPAWNPNIGGIARRAGVTVVPVFFNGRNTAAFQALGLVHSALRTAMLPRQLLNKRGGTIEVRIGQPIPAERIAGFDSDAALTEHLRFRTFLLKSREDDMAAAKRALPRFFRKPRMAAVAEGDAADLLQEEVRGIPPARLMVENGELAVYCVKAQEIPLLMREIGRLREITFRKVGEGTGRSLDLDRFDAHYRHLVVWSRKNNELVGAYRVGKVNQIVHRHGPGGLYTHTLFNYSPELLAELGYAFEMGSSFVRPEYQRSFSPLLMLWKGIGRLVALNPEYRHLIGPVSISNDYTAVSRQLMAAYLLDRHQPAAGGNVEPRNPLHLERCGGIDPRENARFIAGIDEISALVSGIEHDGKGVPVLLRQYLKLGGTILGLNVDRQFGNCLDGLVHVDLARTEPRLLEKYMGREGADAFFAFHHRREDGAGRMPLLFPT